MLKVIDYILTKTISIIILIIILLGSYCLWDSLTIYNSSLPYTLKKYKPKINEESDSLDFSNIQGINANIEGWITINNTNIDYPFVKSSDNFEYLNKDIYNNYSLSGSIFLDPNTNINNNYIILYGHNMKNGSMFGNINKYVHKEYYNSHLDGTLITINNKIYKVKIFALIKVSSNDNIIYNHTSSIKDIISYVKSKHIYYTYYPNITKILAMSTCTSGTNKRLVLLSTLEE